MKHYEFELGHAADILTRDLLKLKSGETFVITADTESNAEVVNATARAAFAIGAKPMVIWLASPLGVGRAADPMLPVEALTGALRGADAWIEFNRQWLLYSTPHDEAMRENKRLRYLCLVGMNPDMMVRCIGRVDHEALKRFLEKAGNVLRAADRIHVTSPSGTELEFRNIAGRGALIRDGYADQPGTFMMGGFIAWAPDLESISGTLVFDGSLSPPCGRLEEPIRTTIEAGVLVGIEGGPQAKQLVQYLDAFDHPRMRRIAHSSFGFHPNARLSGDIVEDERVWGCTEWGIGHVGATLIPPNGIPAPSHSDGQSLNCSVWLDDRPMLETGRVVHPELVELARALGKG